MSPAYQAPITTKIIVLYERSVCILSIARVALARTRIAPTKKKRRNGCDALLLNELPQVVTTSSSAAAVHPVFLVFREL